MDVLRREQDVFIAGPLQMSAIQTTPRFAGKQPEKQCDSGRFGFPVELIGLVLCPRDSGRLTLVSTDFAPSVPEGWVKCDRCNAGYEIRSGILRLMPGVEEIEAPARTEQEARDQGAAHYDARFRPWENAVEVSAILAAVGFPRRGTIVDLACGTGRLTSHLAPLAETTLAVDLSENSLRVLAGKCTPGMRIGLVWSDATQLRLAPDSIDLALATQFLEHIPSRAQRLRFFVRVHAALRDGGEFVLSAYYYSALRALLRRKQEGHHANGIFYHRFTKSEMKSELAGLFQVISTRPIQIDPRLLPLSNRAMTLIAEALERMRLPFWVGQLLLVGARKRPTVAPTNGHAAQGTEEAAKDYER
jgi:SAM-dependent methyltransferase